MHDVSRKIVPEIFENYDFIGIYSTVFSACATCSQVRGSKQKSSVDKEGVDLGGGGGVVTIYIYAYT